MRAGLCVCRGATEPAWRIPHPSLLGKHNGGPGMCQALYEDGASMAGLGGLCRAGGRGNVASQNWVSFC